METLPFASKPSSHSVWGCSDFSSGQSPKTMSPFQASPTVATNGHANAYQMESSSSSEASCPGTNYEYLPAALLNSLKRDKKPFTYTPGRIDLSEVLNDKLRKRNERRRKRAEDRATVQSPVQELPTFESPKQVLVMPTYNSPINMYSMENALEALEVQAEITVGDKSLSPPLPKSYSMTLPRNYKYEPITDFEPKNVTQSKAFRVLQIITDTEEEANQNGPKSKTESPPVEMRFSGTRTSEVIPSKLFHNLQKITDTEEEESPHAEAGFKDSVAHYHDEMRFVGTRPNKAIPSKLFHNLQRLTGTEEEELPQSAAWKNPGPFNAPNPEAFDIQFRPKGDMMMKVKNTLQMKHQIAGKDEKQANIPILQRPAAFLPSTPTTAKSTPCVPRFNAANMPHYQTNSIYSFGK